MNIKLKITIGENRYDDNLAEQELELITECVDVGSLCAIATGMVRSAVETAASKQVPKPTPLPAPADGDDIPL